MATSPAPDAAAPPGMCPGIAVLGGGGGDGDGDGDGSGGRGGAGGGGKGNGKGGKGGGKNGAGCGAGGGAANGGCPNPQHGGAGGGTSAGDPVDVATGRVYTSEVVDLVLPGLIRLSIARSYSSASRGFNVGLGPGWSHSLSWTIEERRGVLRIHQPHAAPTEGTPLKPGEAVVLPCGRLLRDDAGYMLDVDGVRRVFVETGAGRFSLARIHDAKGNLIQLFYEDGHLDQIIDSVGRTIRVRRHRQGLIAAFEVKNASAQGRWVAFRTYEYDSRGDLVAAVDAVGQAQRFEYDDDHRLLRRREPGGLCAEFRYDRSGRCVETWCHREGNDGLDTDVPELLADHQTRAKGFLHVKLENEGAFTQVVTSRSVRTVEANDLQKADKLVWSGGVHTYEYDRVGNVLEYVNSLGDAWRNEYDGAGRVLSTTDPLGATTRYEYDDLGFVAATTDALGRTARYAHDRRGNLLSLQDDEGIVATFEYDDRGLLFGATLPNGGVTRMAYDDLGNRVLVVEPDGARRQIRYDFLGRVMAVTDARGEETRYTYDDCGRLQTERWPSGAILAYEYDVDGNRTRVVDPDGRSTLLRWGGIHVVTEIVRPDGSVVRYRYDREQELVRVINEIDEQHRIHRDGEGRITEERTFDGRVIRYRHDSEGRLVQREEGTRIVDFVYDPVGRLLEKSYSDERQDVFEYDLLGRLVRARSGGVECVLEYDARGNVAREIARHGSHEVVTTRTFDAMGWATRIDGPGGALQVKRDVRGRPIAVEFGDVAPLHLHYDPRGDEIERLLPGGGRVLTETDVDGFITCRRVSGAGARPTTGAHEPEWVGALPLGESLRRVYTRSSRGLLLAEEDLLRGRTDLVRDANGRILDCARTSGGDEHFTYGRSGDLYEPGVPRRYERGGRPIERGATAVVYDDLGRVVEKRRRDGDVELSWRFTWSDDDRLTAVRTPEGTEVTFAYDAFARRVEKRVLRAGVVESITRYNWRGDVLVQELREKARAGGDPIIEERTYACLPEDVLPFAQRSRRDGGAPDPWTHFFYDLNGFPAALVGGDGAISGTLDASLYGDVPPTATPPATPLRFPGQYADEETGLHYNRNRYYDPEMGHYLSPEPIGLNGSLKAYAYVDNFPREWVDVDALARVVTTVTRNDGSTVTGSSGGQDPDDLHPAVQAALPPTPARDPSDPVQPSNCGEPQALSNHLRDWEQRNAPRSCAPGDPGWRDNLNSAMGEIRPNGGISSQQGDQARAPCPNCSQTIPRLYTLAGMPPPNGVCTPGERIDGTNGAASPPPAGYNTRENAAASPMIDPDNRSAGGQTPPIRSGLGTWTYNEQNGFWNRQGVQR